MAPVGTRRRERRQGVRGRRAPEAPTVHLTCPVRGSGRCAVTAAGQPEEAECPKSLTRACCAAGERRLRKLRRPLRIRSCCSSAERSRQHTNGGIPHSRAERARSGPAFSRINIHYARRGATLSDGGGEAEGNAARTALLLSTGSPQPWPHVRLLAFLLRGRLLPAAPAARAPPFEIGSGQEARWDRARARMAGSPGGVLSGGDAQSREGCPLAAPGRNPADAAAGCVQPALGPVAPPPAAARATTLGAEDAAAGRWRARLGQ